MTPNDRILDAICYEWGVTLADLQGPRRHRNLADARLAAGYYLITEGTAERRDMGRLLHRTPGWATWALYRAPELSAMDKRFSTKMADVYAAMKGKAA